MYGKLGMKSKVTSLIRPKTQIFKRKIKQERSSTPQRWSRRIRSLPPIPINVLKMRRHRRAKSVAENNETLSKLVLKNSNYKKQSNPYIPFTVNHPLLFNKNNILATSPFYHHLQNDTYINIFRKYGGDKKTQRFLRNGTSYNSNSHEVLRIVPVVVYIKDNKAKFKSLSDEVEIQVMEKSGSRSFSKTMQEYAFQQKLKKDCSSLEKKWSKRLKTLPLDTLDL